MHRLNSKMEINKLLYFVNIVFIVLFGYYCILNLFGRISKAAFSFILLFPIIFIIIILIPSINERFKNVNDRTLNKTLTVVNIISFVLMLVFAVIMRTEYYIDDETYSWDAGMVCDTAFEYAKNGVIYPINHQILSRYPNNHSIIFMLYCVFKAVNFIFPNMPDVGYSIIAIIINCLFIEIAVVIALLLAKKLLSVKKAFVCGCLIHTCIPLYAYAPFYYSDTLSMPFVVGLPYVYICFLEVKEKRKKMQLTILLSILAVIGYQIKATVIFVVVAILFDMIFCRKSFKFLKSHCKYIVVLGLLFVVLNSGLNRVYSRTFNISQDDYNQYKYPMTHWVMMSLNQDHTGGWVRSDDFLTRYAGNYDEKLAVNIDEIQNRIENLGFIGTVKHVFYTKSINTWALGTLQADVFLSIKPIHYNILHEFFTLSGRFHFGYAIISMLYHCVLMLLIFTAAINCYKEKTFEKMSIIFMPLLMLALFLMIWESNARYILNMMPLMIIAGVSGLGWILKFSYKVKGLIADFVNRLIIKK